MSSASPTTQTTRRVSLEAVETLRLAIEAARLGLWSWDAASDVVSWDDQTCAAYGLEAGAGPTSYRAYRELIHPDDRPAIEASIGVAMRTGTYQDVEHRVVWPDGSIHWVLAKGAIFRGPDGAPRKIIGGVVDITERKQLEEQLRQAQKMEAVGQLTAGIAHNFNNLLMAILPNVELARRASPADLQLILDDIDGASRRGAELVRQLMMFSRSAVARSTPHRPLRPAIEQVLEICRSSFERQIVLELDDRTPPGLICDPSPLQQALLNVLLNARDAVAQRSSPAIRVVVARVGAGEDGLRPPSSLVEAGVPLVRIAVSDNGRGMDDATRRRVFEPFFTTKPVGQGTGLGLATSYAMLHEAGGHIACEPRAGEGSMFVLWLPVTVDTTPERGRETLDHCPGGERVLVVDDEPFVRRAMVRVLSLGGYQVTAVDGGHEALRVYDRPGAFDLVVLDMSMPGLGGEEVRDRLRALDPAARIVFVTGYSAQALSPALGVECVEKPIDVGQLLATIRRLLERR